jgi:mono/diheme cytochrome c family protein
VGHDRRRRQHQGQQPSQPFALAGVCNRWRWDTSADATAAGAAAVAAAPRTASAATVGAGAAAFGAYCGNCHGAGAISLGILPDLRYSERLRSADDWRSVVVDGILLDEGMASFATVLDAKSAEAIGRS